MTEQKHHDTEEEIIELYGDREVRWYQSAYRNAIRVAFAAGKRRLLIVSPTGSGKTVTMAISVGDLEIRKILGLPTDRKCRVTVIAHLHRLLTQAERTFADSLDVDCTVHSAFSPLTQEIIDNTDIFVLDEAHHEAMMSIQYQLENMRNKPVIGLTATNRREDGLLLKFDEEIEILTRDQAVEEGWLARTSVWTVVNSETMCGRSRDADTVDIVSRVVAKYHNIMGQTMIFLRTRSEVTRLADWMTAQGYSNVALLSQTPAQLEAVLTAYEAGEIQFIINCKKIGEGVDCPDTTSIILGKTVGSMIDLNQIIGRASRPNTSCQVFELVNPLNPATLSAVEVVGIPEQHTLVHELRGGILDELEFEVISPEENVMGGDLVSTLHLGRVA